MIGIFTGIVEELGTVREIRWGSQSCQIDIAAAGILEDIHQGDSVAVNGVCLTAVSFNQERFTADVMPETMKKTSLDVLRPGDRVNLERALRLSDRLGGHIMQGHVDGVGRILEQKRVDIALVTRISCPAELMRYVIPRGSVAIDGISLTVVEVSRDSFSVSLIPHTAKLTSLGWKKPGDPVNLETDIIGKYVDHLLSRSGGSKIGGLNMEFLREHGFGV